MSKKMSGISERLKQLAELPEIGTVAKLSRLCMLPDGTIRHAIELHRDPRSSTLKRIVEGTGCRYEWLVNGTRPMFKPDMTSEVVSEDSPEYAAGEAAFLHVRPGLKRLTLKGDGWERVIYIKKTRS